MIWRRIGGVDVHLNTFLASALDGGEWPGSRAGMIILEWILGKKGGDRVDWIHLAQNSGQWRAVVNMVMIQVTLAEWQSASQKDYVLFWKG
jgi:hypothetical protein